MAHRSRINTLQVLVAHSLPPAIGHVVRDELERVCDVGRIRMLPRRYLLEVIHGSRAIDTGLQSYLYAKEGVHRRNIGGVLDYLLKNGIGGVTLSVASHDTYQKAVAAVRNKYAHEAGAFPGGAAEVAKLLEDIEACLSEVLSL